jgi:hypothetical protein
MKARIEKKLSKRLALTAPSLFRGVWVDKDEPSDLAYEQRSRVSHVWSVGGGTDYWGEGQDAYTLWADWKTNWPWHGDFEEYPHEHPLAHYPNTQQFKSTTRNLLRLAAECEARS